MKHTTAKYYENHNVKCGCRSVGECTHGTFAEIQALEEMVDAFVKEMKAKLRKKYMEGFTGWDDPVWVENGETLTRLIDHAKEENPDMVDVANFAAFIWNVQEESK